MDNNIVWPEWTTVKMIGRGNFGAVYEIEKRLGDEVEKAAVKVVSIPQNDHDIDTLYENDYDEESVISSFKEHLNTILGEYSMTRKMKDCPNIVHSDEVRYSQHDDGIGWDIFIKMELLTPLKKAFPGEYTETDVIKLGQDICNALIACNKKNIIHRDIKPENIFVSEDGNFKLGDFGIAKTVEKTKGGTLAGTTNYMAPEVFRFAPYGHTADIYSLGLVMYWMLNRKRLPFLPLPPEKMSGLSEERARQRRLSGEQIPGPAHGSEKLKQIVLKA